VNRELLIRQLAKLGVEGVAVAGGHEAVEAVVNGSYDAVLMDFHMPEVDGPQAARAIRAIPGERGAVPIVAITGTGTPEERGACLASGMTDVLRKPVGSGDLARALEGVLGAGAAGEPVTPAIDRDTIDRLDADIGDTAELRRIAGIFIAQIDPGTRAIAADAAAGDSEALRRSAHRLGGAGATFGAARVADLCGRLEALGAAGRADASAALVRELEAEATRAVADLQALLGLD
jgi:CheY-like chemotaxis protein/HPt (histidine-containing phosphotransfer) domain-containing protein